ncbi:TIGR04376 family protein [Geitlerinema sp. P-1104]|uniref:TIGR04376 family protein n=1 Tax=Geitlerinema sp. P-1104 TaxID=2546230 RepID=UPI0014769D57|nr:TIGR04376 family protein [Geitlerinema sp. P-1104]
MGLFEDLSQFLETRLEEFLAAHPHLELQAIEEQLREQEEDTLRLIASLQAQEKKLEEDILSTAQDIQRWHMRIQKAQAAGREDLVQPAQEREALLLRQGNQLWGQRQGVQDRLSQAKNLKQNIQARRQEVHAKAAQWRAEQAESSSERVSSWDNPSYTRFPKTAADPLEQVFSDWETEDELSQLKRQMGQ